MIEVVGLILVAPALAGFMALFGGAMILAGGFLTASLGGLLVAAGYLLYTTARVR